MKKLVSFSIFVVLVAAIFVAIQPFMTVRAIQQGLQAQDQAELEYHIDFPMVREGLKEQVTEVLNAQAKATLGNSPFAMFGAALAGKLADSMVDSYVTPEGLVQVFSGQVDAKALKSKKPVNSKKPVSNPSPDEIKPEAEKNEVAESKSDRVFSAAEYDLVDFDLIVLTLPTEEGKPPVKVELTRRGIQWRMTRIVLPTEQLLANK